MQRLQLAMLLARLVGMCLVAQCRAEDVFYQIYL
jgi:hypothetical protein